MSGQPFASRPGFTPEQRSAFSDRSRELAVAAAAGSGKTSVLVERILHRILGVDSAGQFDPESAVGIDRLLVVTFTVAAADELRARLSRELARVLERNSLPPAQRELARRQLALLPLARISTIHSCCAALLRQYGTAAGLGSRRQLADHENKLLLHQLATEFLDRQLDGSDPAVTALALAWGGADGVGPEDLGRSLRRGGGLRALLLGLFDFRRSLISAEAWFGALPLHQPLDPDGFDGGHPLVAEQFAALRRWASGAADATRLELHALEREYPGVPHLELLALRADALEGLTGVQDWGRAQLLLDGLYVKQNGDPGTLKLKGNPTLLGLNRQGIDTTAPWHQRVEYNRDLIKQAADGWRDIFGMPWADVARLENEAADQLRTLWKMTRGFATEYAAYKAARGVQDYSDLERGALRLLAVADGAGEPLLDGNGQPEPSAAALALQAQFAEVLVDEYQDTNQLQEGILGLLTPPLPAVDGCQPRARFVVGDVKQSIYAFRLAEPELFQTLCGRLLGGRDSVGALHRLNRNFRSRQSLVAAINSIFTGLMTPEFGGDDYEKAALEYGADYAGAFDAENAASADRPAGLHCVVLEAAAAENDAEAEGAGAAVPPGSRDACGYAYVAGLLQEIHTGGQLVLDPEAPAGSRVRPVQWRDMVVLLRSTTGLETLRAALAAAGIPHLAASRSGFYERPEIADALSLLMVIDNPLQDIPLAAVLRGPAVGLNVEELLELVPPENADCPTLWERLAQRRDDPQRQDVLARRLSLFTDQLEQWRNGARYLPLAELLWRVYAESGLLLASGALRGGAQRYANLIELHEQTRRFGANDRQGLARFIEEQRRLALAAGDAGEPPLPGDGQDMVRIMTIHQSKGLEFPVVVIPDIQRRFNEAGLHADVLWHKGRGLGGIHLDLHAARPRITPTLAYRLVQSARHRGLLEEELRLLYVALTRARERLELVCVVEAGKLANAPPPPEQARSRWDWLQLQLATEVAAAQSDRVAEGPWQVRIIGAAEIGPARGVPAQAVPPQSPEAIAAVLARLQPAERPVAAPYKVVVSDLARQERQAAQALADEAERQIEWDAGNRMGASGSAFSPVRPRLPHQPRVPTPADLGSAVHAVIGAVSRRGWFRDGCSPAQVQLARDELVAVAALTAAEAEGIDVQRLATGINDICARLELRTARLYSELPVSLLTPLPGTAPVSVIVQGTLDLLAVWPGRALVLDFKTDRSAGAHELETRYAPQLGWYATMARALTGLPAVEWALYGLDGVGLVGPFAHAELASQSPH
jgi:ATP-dependent helicase/nuclease subunit A